jgi:LysM repeat protein
MGMNDLGKQWRTAGALAVGLGLAACGGKGATPPASVAALASPASPAEVDAIMALLDGGEEKAARKRVAAALKRDPMNPSLLVLRDSLDRDPTELLGPASYPYTVRPGDTMTGLAERFLGNRLKAYQLARYNAVDKPAELAPGRVLRIPGTAPVVERVEREEPRRTERKAPKPALASPKPKPSAPKPAAVAATPRAADPGAARAARAAGLAALNQGQVSRAVGLLRRAASLDPANPVAQRDLARAERIASAVRARR